MPVPEVSHLQFLVLQILGGLERRGREIRERLEDEGETRTLTAFYQIMSRLELAKLVSGSSRPFESEGKTFHERLYKLTARGERARREAIDFYALRSLIKEGDRARYTI